MDIKFRQRVAVDISKRSTEMEMLGEKLPIPVALAPTGLAGMQTADGEIHAARAAEKFGVPFTLSTMSVCSIEEVQSKTRSVCKMRGEHLRTTTATPLPVACT